VARGSLEAPGYGLIGPVVPKILSSIPGSDSDALTYPAKLNPYVPSEASGVEAMHSAIVSYESRCPSSKIALLGYSQGAQVVGDVLCGTTQRGWNITAPLNATLSKAIIASIQMGDPTFALDQVQDVGNATKGGIFKRNDTAACPSGIMKSYCSFNDTYCDFGSSIQVHISYVGEYGDAAAQWVVEKFVAVNGTNTTSSDGTPTSTSPASASASTSMTMSNANRLEGTYTTLTSALELMILLACVGI
jgi:acetylxylan esterase